MRTQTISIYHYAELSIVARRRAIVQVRRLVAGPDQTDSQIVRDIESHGYEFTDDGTLVVGWSHD